ncbi:MAG: biotin--[acetyl-CoA-carboxylase] ligase [Alkalinema sp. RU_4_3]|nr:biotin--[acetyl-CoA-carboxylase] ligase [Alkalinema sp. RU_4_3]
MHSTPTIHASHSQSFKTPMPFDRTTFHQSLTFFQAQAGLPEETVVLHWFETTDSTNRKLWGLIDRGLESPVVIAETQTAGKGQYGRQWVSSPGGLYLSMAIAPQSPAQMTLTTVWGLAELLNQAGIPVQIKWLNDLVIQGRKLGGILTEAKWRGGEMAGAIVGIGLNVSNPVPETGISLQQFFTENATTLHDFLQKVPGEAGAPLEKVAGLCVASVQLGQQCLTNFGLDVLRDSYQAHLAHLGQPVQIDGRQGIIVGVRADGNLCVRFMSEGRDLDLSSEEEIYLQPGTMSLGYC